MFIRKRLENSRNETFEEGYRIQFKGINATIIEVNGVDGTIKVRFDEGEQRELNVEEVDKLTRDRGHCHGCNKFQVMEVYPLEQPQHSTGRTFGWECQHCRFINATFHSVRNHGTCTMKCNDCQALI